MKRGELQLYGRIGPSVWDDDEGITAKSVAGQLKALGEVDEILVHINSPGGLIWDGQAIYNQLNAHPARVIVEVDGLAASAASLIAMAGDEIRVAENGQMMIHNAMWMTVGNRHVHEKSRAVLEKLDGILANVYARRSRQPATEIAQWMDEETWFTAAEAVARGLADAVTPAKEVKSQFDGQLLAMFRRPPADVRQFFGTRSVAACAFSTPDRELLALEQLIGAYQMAQTTTQQPTPDTAPANTAADNSGAPPATPAQATPVAAVAGAAAAETAAAPTAAQLLQAREEGRRLEAERQSKIIAKCQAAGMMDRAAEWCANPHFSVENATEALFAALADRNRVAGELGGAPGKGIEEGKPADPLAKYRAEYAAGQRVYAAQGITEADFVATRQIDEGEVPLVPFRKPQTTPAA